MAIAVFFWVAPIHSRVAVLVQTHPRPVHHMDTRGRWHGPAVSPATVFQHGAHGTHPRVGQVQWLSSVWWERVATHVFWWWSESSERCQVRRHLRTRAASMLLGIATIVTSQWNLLEVDVRGGCSIPCMPQVHHFDLKCQQFLVFYFIANGILLSPENIFLTKVPNIPRKLVLQHMMTVSPFSSAISWPSFRLFFASLEKFLESTSSVLFPGSHNSP